MPPHIEHHIRHGLTLRFKLTIVSIGCLLVIAGYGLYTRARAHVRDATPSGPNTSQPKIVPVVEVRSQTYQPERRYVTTTRPWVVADLGPQFVAAFVTTVAVRPGDVTQRGQILATLDCRDARASHQAVAAQVRALDARQKASASEATRVNSLLEGGFAAPNEAEQKTAASNSQLAELMATRANQVGKSLAVNDCVVRSPFDGEVSARYADPGAFVRPGAFIVSVVDRSTIRLIADVPESDFDLVAPGKQVTLHMLATNTETTATIMRRSPEANDTTRTVHFEVDLPDPKRTIPVGTTAEMTLKIGTPEPASVVPLRAASVRGKSATMFVVEGGRAKKIVVALKGESHGRLFVDPSIKPGTKVVTEGRSLLADGDAVTATVVSGDSSAPVDEKASP